MTFFLGSPTRYSARFFVLRVLDTLTALGPGSGRLAVFAFQAVVVNLTTISFVIKAARLLFCDAGYLCASKNLSLLT